MTPDEYEAARQSLNWTHAHVAEAIGVSGRAPYRYASGAVDIPEPTARLLRLLVLLHLTSSWSLCMVSPPSRLVSATAKWLRPCRSWGRPF
jgi:hypothetical protein